MASTWRSTFSKRLTSASHAPLGPAAAILALGVAQWLGAMLPASACPFCTAVEPTLAQRRQQAQVTCLAEVQSRQGDGRFELRLHQVLAGKAPVERGTSFTAQLDLMAQDGTLLLLFGTSRDSGGANPAGAELKWQGYPTNELSYAYFAKAPDLRVPSVERLRYFAGFLEHRDPQVAHDAYSEFAHASFADVAVVADVLPGESLRRWLVDEAVPPARKGFYGLALGLVKSPAERSANAEFLRTLVLKPDDDFRAGFDGILGGYLLLSGVEGLELIENRYLADAQARDGDVRHALVALRFYYEFGREIPASRLQASVRQLLTRPEFAAAAITDLARWQDWQALESIADLYALDGKCTPTTRHAIVGYLLACPEPASARALARLRELDPQGVAAAEQIVSQTGSLAPAAQ